MDYNIVRIRLWWIIFGHHRRKKKRVSLVGGRAPSVRMTTTDGAAVDDEIVFDVPTRMCIAKLLTIDLGALNGMTNVNGALLQFCFFAIRRMY